MTQEELKKLSREYAEYVCPAEKYETKEERNEDLVVEYDFALPVLQWLAKNYHIEKKKQL